MENPKELKYTREHEWIKVENNTATIGITDFAQNALNDIVFVELPETGKKVEQSKTAAAIESVKSVSDIFSPVSGEVIGVNDKLKGHPDLVNKSPYDNGWLFKVKLTDKNEINDLMSSEEYAKMVEKE